MYKEMTLKDFKCLRVKFPEDMSLWLTEEAIKYLKENICSEDLESIKSILYRDFLKQNPSFPVTLYPG
jgi:hypothetical protein